MYSVYVLQHTDTKQFYIGRTNNLKRRLSEHNASQNKSTHRNSGEWILIYAEAYRSKDDAVKRELRLKKYGRAKQELLKRAVSSQIY
jgi:putative endonuclease